MEKALNIINQMVSEGVFERYAIGGGIAAFFYIEPFATFDLDIFVVLNEGTSPLVSLSPIYEWLKKQGHKPKDEQIIIAGIPVQFIPVYNDLVKEAVFDAIKQRYKETEIFVLKPEYLIAIMVQTFRPKDKERIIKFLEETDISKNLLDNILIRYNLKSQFDNFIEIIYGK